MNLIIERTDGPPLTLDEWTDAVFAIKGARPMAGATHTHVNPMTQELVTITERVGETEVFLPGELRWAPAFGWQAGRAIFHSEAPTEVQEIAKRLAVALGAVIRRG